MDRYIIYHGHRRGVNIRVLTETRSIYVLIEHIYAVKNLAFALTLSHLKLLSIRPHNIFSNNTKALVNHVHAGLYVINTIV